MCGDGNSGRVWIVEPSTENDKKITSDPVTGDSN